MVAVRQREHVRIALTSDEELSEAEETSLLSMARGGDSESFAELIRRNLGAIRSAAHYFSRGVLDPDELTGHALLGATNKWASGKLPEAGLRSYIVASVRNRAIDEFGAARNRNVPLLDVPHPTSDGDLGTVEDADDHELITQALSRVPQDQRTALIAVIVEGTKPGDLIDVLGRSAPAISSLVQRAKLNLRRALLEVMAEAAAQDGECVIAARGIPQRLPTEVTSAHVTSIFPHATQCKPCGDAWGRFLALRGRDVA